MRERSVLLLRSFLVQGAWNYQTLIGTGFAFLMLPVLRRRFAGDPVALEAAIRRHVEIFNSHPYLVTVAAGAVARLEDEGTDPVIIQRFKSALRSSLGSLGDRLVWLVWRPTVALLGVALFLSGAPWWAAVGTFLVVYNAFHLWLRVRGLQVGLGAGMGVGTALRELPLQRWNGPVAGAGAALAGFALALVIADYARAGVDVGVGVAAAGAGLWLGTRTRPVVWAGLTLAWMLGVAVGFIS